ncbi:hypothetical protein CR513_05938, partial [Mucuna pruriens]
MSPYRIVFDKACHLPVSSVLDGMDHLLSLMFFPMVNEHHLKEFHELPTPTVGEVESISLVEPT